MIWWFAAPTALASEPGPIHRHAVVIGADEGGSGDVPLRYAEHDAERFAEVLTSVGGFADADVALLRGASAPGVLDALEHVRAKIAAGEQDGDTLLVVFYSGHADADALHLGETILPMERLIAQLEDTPVDVRLLVVDACRSGSLIRPKGVTPAQPFTIEVDQRLRSEGMAIIASASATEDAQESDRLGGGIFSHHFVAGLLGAADASGDGLVTLTEAYDYGYTQTLRSTSQAPVVQHPTFAFELTGHRDLVLTRPTGAEPGSTLVLDSAGTYLVFRDQGHGSLYAELTVPSGGQLAIDPGSYLIRLREPGAIRELTVHPDRGQSVHVHRDQMATVPYGATVRRGLSPQLERAIGLGLGVGLTGPLVPTFAGGPTGMISLRIDQAELSIGARVHGRLQRSPEGAQQRRLGVDLWAMKVLDVGRWAPGIGLAAGLDTAHLRYESPTLSASGLIPAGRLGPTTGLAVALGARNSLALSAGVDMVASWTWSEQLASRAVARVDLEWITYLR